MVSSGRQSTRAAPGPSLPWLVGDIGGTNARFGWVDDATRAVKHVHTLAVAAHAGPAAAARAYLAALSAELRCGPGSGLGDGAPMPQRAALAVATAVTGDRVELTNGHWRFSCKALQAELGLRCLTVLNDFEALALSLPQLGAQQLLWHGPALRPSGVMAVIGPGTGLGVAAVVQTRHGWQALPGQGGHATLSAACDFESRLLAHVRRTHAHVSAERLLSGIGLPLLHTAVAAVLGQSALPLTARDIVERGVGGGGVGVAATAAGGGTAGTGVAGGTAAPGVAGGAAAPGVAGGAAAPGVAGGAAAPGVAGGAAAPGVAGGSDAGNPRLTGDALCELTLDTFCALLGGFAGNVALTLGARGGVYIGGGIVPRLGERFFASRFRQRFEAKGRFRSYLEAIPTAVIIDTSAGLSGAAAAIEQATP